VSLSCEETVQMIRSFGCRLSLTVVTVFKSTDSSATGEMCKCICGLSLSYLLWSFLGDIDSSS